MKKASLKLIAIIALFMFTAQLSAKASDITSILGQVADDALKTATVLQVNIGFSGQTVVVIVDRESGAIYITDCPYTDVHTGDTVHYTTQKSTPKGTIIIRDITR